MTTLKIPLESDWTLGFDELRALLLDTRARTHELVADLSDDQLEVPLEVIVNPFRWELGHVAFFYDAFVLAAYHGMELHIENGNELFNSFVVDHDDRWQLPLGPRAEILDYMARVHADVLERLGSGEATPVETYLHFLGVLHEDMHCEAFTYMRQTLGYPQPTLTATVPEEPAIDADCRGDVEVPGGRWMMGAERSEPFVFDNEKWSHPVELAPFRISRAAVTNAEFVEFVDSGGYSKQQHWDYQGWLWRSRCGLQHPRYWHRSGGGWMRKQFDQLVPLEEHHPVCNVSWFEALAYCNWAGRRLPSEAEWDVAATGVRDGNRIGETRRRYPWGDAAPTSTLANLDGVHHATVDVRAFAAGDSGFGCRQMLGNTWEWTSSPFYPFPGYIVDAPYAEYSAPWFGYRKVLRGGAWATRSRLARNGYRNFFPPDRNDTYAGFRTCAL